MQSFNNGMYTTFRFKVPTLAYQIYMEYSTFINTHIERKERRYFSFHPMPRFSGLLARAVLHSGVRASITVFLSLNIIKISRTTWRSMPYMSHDIFNQNYTDLRKEFF